MFIIITLTHLSYYKASDASDDFTGMEKFIDMKNNSNSSKKKGKTALYSNSRYLEIYFDTNGMILISSI